MPADPSPPAPPAARPRRRWLRRVLTGAGLLLVLLAVFHRPLAHWSIRYFGGSALARAGLSGEWRTSGTLFTGLSVDALRLTGNDIAQVRSVTLKHAELDYDLLALRGGGPGEVLKRLVVEDLEVEMDLTKPGPPPAPRKSPASKSKPQLPSVLLPEIRIHRANVRIRMRDDRLVVRNFSLVLTPAAPGLIEAELLDLPGMPEFTGVRGLTRVEPRRLVLEHTALTPETVIERLAVDLADLARDRATVELVARQGGARAEIRGSSGGWFTSATADMTLAATGLTSGTLAFWGVPDGGVAWEAGDLRLAVSGPVLHPDQLHLALALKEGRVQAAGRLVSPVSLDAAAGDGVKAVAAAAGPGAVPAGGKDGPGLGKFEISGLSAESASAVLSASGGAALPAEWGAIAGVAGRLGFTLEVPELAAQLPPDSGVAGRVRAAGGLEFAGGKVGAASAEVTAESVRVRGVPVEFASARARLADGAAVLESASARLNARNTLTASGRMALDETQAASVQWRLEAQDLSSVPREVRGDLLWPSAGTVLSTGSAEAELAGLKDGHWEGLKGGASVEVSGLRLGEAAMDSLRLAARAEGGVVTVESLKVALDAANTLQAAGSLDLNQPTHPLAADLTVALREIARLSVWSTQFGGPALQGGQAELNWKGQGELSPLQGSGSGSLQIGALRLAGVPEVLGLGAEVTQSGSEISVRHLTASAGPWRAEGAVHWDGWHLTIPQLQAFAGRGLLGTLQARVPWHGGVVPADSPVSLNLEVKDLDPARLSAAIGQEMPVRGLLNADATFTGTLRALEGNLSLAATGVRPGRTPEGAPELQPATVKLTATARGGQLKVEGSVLQPPLQPLTLQAAVPADVMRLMAEPAAVRDLPLSGNVRLPASSLGFLPSWVPALRSVEGTAAADVAISGTLGRPVWRGQASLRVPQADFDSSALPTVKDLNLRLRADGRRLTLEEGHVTLAGGRLRLGGSAGLENPADPQLDFSLNAGEVLVVRDENLSLRANAALRCRGRLSRAEVTGSIDLVRGRVFKEIEFLPLSLPNDLPPPPPATAVGREGPPSLPAPLDAWSFNIAIRTRDPVRLMGNVARGNAVADLRLSGSGARPELAGKVRLEEMWLQLPFSRLTITHGELSFVREAPFDPQIDITGESITGSRVVQVFVQGRALDPKVRLTSSPPLPEGEIAALLATGVTTSDLTSSGDEAAGRAAYVLLKQTYRRLFRRNALDNDDDEPPRLSFDFSVFGTDPSRRGVSAIYELNPRWRLIGRVGETGTFRGMLHYLIRFR